MCINLQADFAGVASSFVWKCINILTEIGPESQNRLCDALYILKLFLGETIGIEQWPDTFQSCSQFTKSTFQL